MFHGVSINYISDSSSFENLSSTSSVYTSNTRLQSNTSSHEQHQNREKKNLLTTKITRFDEILLQKSKNKHKKDTLDKKERKEKKSFRPVAEEQDEKKIKNPTLTDILKPSKDTKLALKKHKEKKQNKTRKTNNKDKDKDKDKDKGKGKVKSKDKVKSKEKDKPIDRPIDDDDDYDKNKIKPKEKEKSLQERKVKKSAYDIFSDMMFDDSDSDSNVVSWNSLGRTSVGWESLRDEVVDMPPVKHPQKSVKYDFKRLKTKQK